MKYINLLLISTLFYLASNAHAQNTAPAKSAIERTFLVNVYDQEFKNDWCKMADEEIKKRKIKLTRLSYAESCAIYYYTGYGYRINNILWGSSVDSSELPRLQNNPKFAQSFINVLDSALQKMPPQGSKTLYRLAYPSPFKSETPGERVILKGYSSTSGRLGAFGNCSEDAFLLIITATSGKKIGHLSFEPEEEEYLLPRNTVLELEKAEFKNMKINNECRIKVIYAKEVSRQN